MLVQQQNPKRRRAKARRRKSAELIVICLLFAGTIVCAAQRDRVFTYESKGKRDPMAPLVTKDGVLLPGLKQSSETEDMSLEGIIWDRQGNSIAIINGRPMREQERVDSVQLLKIKEGSVIMQREGKVVVLYLKKEGR